MDALHRTTQRASNIVIPDTGAMDASTVLVLTVSAISRPVADAITSGKQLDDAVVKRWWELSLLACSGLELSIEAAKSTGRSAKREAPKRVAAVRAWQGR